MIEKSLLYLIIYFLSIPQIPGPKSHKATVASSITASFNECAIPPSGLITSDTNSNSASGIVVYLIFQPISTAAPHRISIIISIHASIAVIGNPISRSIALTAVGFAKLSIPIVRKIPPIPILSANGAYCFIHTTPFFLVFLFLNKDYCRKIDIL